MPASRPAGSERAVRDGAWEEYHSHTWVTWEELAAVDWDEQAPDWSDEHRRVDGDRDRDGPPEMISRHQTLDADWHFLMEMAEPLVRRYGADRVRLVVWFDNGQKAKEHVAACLEKVFLRQATIKDLDCWG